MIVFSIRKGVNMNNFVSYFELNNFSGMLVFSDKGVEVRSADENNGFNIISCFTLLASSKRVKQLLKNYKPDETVRYSIVERIRQDKSVTLLVKKEKINKTMCDIPVYEISSHDAYEKDWFYNINHTRYFFTIDALYIAIRCAHSYWAGITPVSDKSLKQCLKGHNFRYVRHCDIRDCCIDFV